MAKGTPDLKLPDDLRQALHGHLETLRQNYERRGWGRRSGYGARPAVVVIDLALAWTDPRYTTLGSDLDSVVEQTLRVLRVRARGGAGLLHHHDRGAGRPSGPGAGEVRPGPARQLPRIAGGGARPPPGAPPEEKLIVKKYASCFKGTDLMEMLATVGADTLVVTGCSTSHCVYATHATPGAGSA